MAAALAFLGMWLLSLVVAVLAALQLGDFLRAGDLLPLLLAATAAHATLTIVVLGIGYRLAKQASQLDAVAFVLAMLAVALALWPDGLETIAAPSGNPSVASEPTFLALELLVPALLAILIQWGLVRQRWLRAADQEDISRWPWFSTMASCVLALNPFGLAFIWSALHAAASDSLKDFAIALVMGTAYALVVVGAIECYIRWRIQRRRLEG
jgi:hypothetical protein